ncbi:SKT5 [Candida oxycetoniae]|uniref:SKT5 n=1 Tax=Candida oxycetoniae TaxID=497107 RepID=A0AAI9T1D5_9ASCO|nr:SKT5 [Candida oxycetoniae]KAI3406255.2 SKT5 [Candida oxycetoniae]
MSTRSQHPYRQVSAGSSAPYPLSAFNPTNSQSDRSDSSPSMTEITSGMEDLQIPTNYEKGYYQQPQQLQQLQHPQHPQHLQQPQPPQQPQQPQQPVLQMEQQYQQVPLQQQAYRGPMSPQENGQMSRNVSGGSGNIGQSPVYSHLPPHLIPHLPQFSNQPPPPPPPSSSTATSFSQFQSPILPTHPHHQQSFEQPAYTQSPKIGVVTNGRSTSSSGGPYQAYESLTPPSAFVGSKESIVVSPPSNPLSATSSVTNLNLNNNNNNQQSLDNQIFSRSENNLSTPSVGKYGHNRSVSSTSSFFYDRNDNSSMVDFNQNVIQQYLGSNSQNLMPRIKTLELYRKNAKKSNDPNVLFQYAQYMLQTALILAADSNSSNTDATTTTISSQSSSENSNSNISSRKNDKPSHKKSKSFDFVNNEVDGDEKKLRKSLLKEAVFYLKKLSDKGYVEAQYLLGDAYSSGALDKIENREAFILFQAAAKHGHVESAYRTSYCYEEGLGTGRDARKAVEYLKIAAAKNHPAAMYKLGVYSFYSRMGLGTDMNTKKMGIKWLTRATNVATELTAAAPFELGKLYYNGFEDIVIADKKYALELYAQAAALGHTQSAAILGSHYEYGDDVIPQDSNLSIHYYTQAALGGDAPSMLSMCAWYLVGAEPYLPKDEVEAFEWAKRAASCNLPKAQFALANFYEKGIGCNSNVAEAQNWYRKAAENGDEKSLSRLTDKELVKHIQKRLAKRKKAANNGNGGNGNGNNGNGNGMSNGPTKASPQKDCVVM